MAQRFTVPRDSSLLECLFELFPQQSRTGVKAYLKDGRVIVNGVNRTAFDWLLKKGDTIEILSKGASIGRDMKEDADSLLRREGISIVFEDAHLIVIDKNAGVPVNSPKNSDSGRRAKSVQSLMTDYMHTEKRANGERGLLLNPIMGMPRCCNKGRNRRSSSVIPLYEMAITTSLGSNIPRSPWYASSGFTKKEGVPVEASVAAILHPIWPLLPTPVMINLPWQLYIMSTARSKSEPMRGTRSSMACASS